MELKRGNRVAHCQDGEDTLCRRGWAGHDRIIVIEFLKGAQEDKQLAFCAGGQPAATDD